MNGWTGPESALFHAALVSYFVTGAVAAVHLATGGSRARQLGTGSLLASFGFLTAFIGARWWHQGRLPLGTPSFDLVFLGYVLTGTLVVFDLRFRLSFVRAFVTPIVVLIFFMSLFAISTSRITTAGTPHLLLLHIGTVMLALSLYLLASVLGVLYLRAHARLKAHATDSPRLRPPPLERLDHLGQIILTAGFVVLTLSLLAGALYGRSAGATGELLEDPRVVAAIVLWVLLAVLTHLRSAGRLSGRRSAQLTLLGVVLLSAVYLAMTGGLHQ